MSQSNHLLSFVTNHHGNMVTIHTDLAGIDFFIGELAKLRDLMKAGDCPHTHLHSIEAAGNELSTAKLKYQPAEVNNVYHVKIYGWNAEWSVRHGLVGASTV